MYVHYEDECSLIYSKRVCRHMSVNACLCPVVSVHGCAVITVEGIGNTRTRLHPVQERIARSHGSQCGFCTPGIVMSAYAMFRSLEKPPDEKHLEIALQGGTPWHIVNAILTKYREFRIAYRSVMVFETVISDFRKFFF